MGRSAVRRHERASVAHDRGDRIATPTAALIAGVLLLVAGWNVALGGRIAQHRDLSPPLRWLSGFVALLLLPGAAVSWFATAPTAGAALHDIAWLWPLVALLAMLQALVALREGAASRVVSLPFALWNTLICWVLTVRWLAWLGVALPGWMLIPGGATVTLTALLLGPASAALPSLPLMPLLAPAYPPRARWSVPIRSLLGVGVSIGVVLVATEGVTGTQPWMERLESGQRVTERDPSRFSVGLTVLPPLAGPPPAAAIRRDIALADSLGVRLIHVRLLPGISGAALDSISHVLEPWRRDSITRIVVSLDQWNSPLSRTPKRRWRPAEVEAVTRRVRPHILVADARSLLEDAARAAATPSVVRRVRPATLVLAGITRVEDLSAPALEGLTRGEAAVNGFWLTLRPDPSGAHGLDRRLAPVDGWLSTSASVELWVHAVPGLPLVEGELTQASGVHLLLAWASARPRVRAVVLDGAGDHLEVVGLRASNGRLRQATLTLARDLRTLIETPSR